MISKRRGGLLLAAILLSAATGAFAQAPAAYPGGKPIKLVVAYPAGGNSDGIARILSDRFAEQLGTSVFVENKGGASGQIALELVKGASADGYTLLFGNASSFSLQPHLRKAPYKLEDFTILGAVADYLPVLAVRKNMGVTSIAELLKYAKANPGKVTFGSSGLGTTSHFSSEALAKSGASKFLHVPFKGSAEALTALIGGQIDFLIDGVTPNAVKAGQVVGLATFAKRRHPEVPNIPTIYESGVNLQLAAAPTWMLMAPKGMPKAVSDRLSQTLQRTLEEPATMARLLKISAAPSWVAPVELEKVLQSDFEFYGRLTKDLGMTQGQ